LASIPIYTIGYGNRLVEEFIGLLQQYEIRFLVDIRSQPYSRYNPDFSKDALEKKSLYIRGSQFLLLVLPTSTAPLARDQRGYDSRAAPRSRGGRVP
jgi:uncharacterized protein (DUF488 family)